MDVSEAIRTKRAVRQFKDQPLPEDAVEAILNAARRSPTSSNSQYLTFVAVRDPEVKERLAEIRTGAKPVATAPLVVVVVAQTLQWGTSIINFDIGQAATYMMLEAWSLGIGCNVAWFGEGRVHEVLNLPDDSDCEWAVAFGYPANDAVLTAPMKPGGRKPLEEVVRWDRWG